MDVSILVSFSFNLTLFLINLIHLQFSTATEKAKSFTKTPPNDVFLEFYGLYKQATVGDCNCDKPSAINVKESAKWNAWNGNKGMSQDAAKAAYVQVYEKYAPKYA